MNCRDCLHFKACYEMAVANRAEEFNTLFANKCESFTARSEWVHLSCKVGDKVFLLLETMYGNYKIVKSKCVKIINYGNEIDYSMYINCPEIDNSIEFNAFDFGKVVFLDLEEAKKALEEKK